MPKKFPKTPLPKLDKNAAKTANRKIGWIKRKIKKTVAARLTHPRTKQGRPARLKRASNQLRAVQLRIEGYSEADIGKALGVSQSHVSSLLKTSLEEHREQTNALAGALRDMELIRVDQQILAWNKRARKDPRASDVYLTWVERRQKLLGLEINKTEFSGHVSSSMTISTAHIDINKLNDEQLGWLEIIMQVAGPPIDSADLLALEHKPTAALEPVKVEVSDEHVEN
jgi:hypothetical protein